MMKLNNVVASTDHNKKTIVIYIDITQNRTIETQYIYKSSRNWLTINLTGYTGSLKNMTILHK